MDTLKITAGSYTFKGRFEDKLAPKTCAKFRSLLPYQERIIHVRWSGEACWIPLGELDLGLTYDCLLYTSPSPRDRTRSRMPSSA